MTAGHAGRCVAAARRAGGGRRAARDGCRASVSGLNPTAVREWARAQGIEVNDRGRARAELVARFKTAIAIWAPKYGHHSHGSFTNMPN